MSHLKILNPIALTKTYDAFLRNQCVVQDVGYTIQRQLVEPAHVEATFEKIANGLMSPISTRSIMILH